MDPEILAPKDDDDPPGVPSNGSVLFEAYNNFELEVTLTSALFSLTCALVKLAVLSGTADHDTLARLDTPLPADPLIELSACTVKITGPVAFVTGLISIDIKAGVAPTTPTGKSVAVPNAEEVLLEANVLANGPLIKFVALDVPLKVPANVVVPSLNILVDVVFMIPAVMVNVPLIDIGTLSVTPVALLLLIVNEAMFAVGLVEAFLYIPDPPMV